MGNLLRITDIWKTQESHLSKKLIGIVIDKQSINK